jgi:hypothetical protein
MTHEHPLSDHPSKKPLTEVNINGKWQEYGLMSKDRN